MTITYPKVSAHYLISPIDCKKTVNAKHLKSFKNKYFELDIDMSKITKETEKAIFINDTDYSNRYFDGDDTIFGTGFWVPKSQMFINDNKICVAGFIARQHELFVVCK